MPHTNSWLCIYAIAQLGKPYRMGTYGHFEKSTQTELKQQYYTTTNDFHANPNYNQSVKTHDCSGLPLGALMCDTVDGTPSGSAPIAHGSTSQFNGNCSTKSNSMSNFPYLPGTLVFVKGDGSTKTHVGIYVGTFTDLDGNTHEDAVVEAKGRNWGVVYSKVTDSKWAAWGQLTVCSVDTTKDTKFDARVNAISTTISNMNGQAMIEAKNLKPFVATIPQGQNITLDYDKLKEARVSAMMFFAGELYDGGHTKKTYLNPYLAKQVNACNSAGMLYSLYANVRARNEIEADEECRALYYIVAQFPPAMGLWFSLQLGSNVSKNNAILEVYYKYMERWGLKYRCGLYVTPEQLATITWGKFQDRFYLWLIDPMDVNEVDDELLQPEMFEVPD